VPSYRNALRDGMAYRRGAYGMPLLENQVPALKISGTSF
jgi:hypothetical protein